VRVVKNDPNGYGNVIVIRHWNGLETVYGHLSKQIVKPNEIIKAGHPIGLAGNTGRSSGTHLHFETRFCGIPINPLEIFSFKDEDVVGDFYHWRK
jgi:murein DD-endopeptidase MepM/ murein hydrolase activator NlpD